MDDEELIGSLAGDEAADVRRCHAAFHVEVERRRLEAANVESMCRHSTAYPERLLNLRDPPSALYVAGGAGRLAELIVAPVVTLVGARDATPYALEVARSLGAGLASAGVTVVSGLALGVDAAAHRGTAHAGGGLIAVLAGGPDVPYPRTNAALYRRIRARGAILAELPPGTAPVKWSFPARNRIMAALARVTVVVEAAAGSGSLITADFAEDLGRTVGAVPGRVTGDKAVGSNALLRDGAHVIRGTEDVIDALMDAGEPVPDRPAQPHPPGEALDEPARRVLAAVEAGYPVDAIGDAACLPAADVRIALGRLELAGLVARDGLGRYERRAGRR